MMKYSCFFSFIWMLGSFPAVADASDLLYSHTHAEPEQAFLLAKTWFLPDYQETSRGSASRSETSPLPDGSGNNPGKCETYSLLSAVPPLQECRKVKPLPDLICYDNCKCLSAYNKTSCPAHFHLAGGPCRFNGSEYYAACEPDPCPDGSAVDTVCDNNRYDRITAGYSGSKACYKCQAKACPAGSEVNKSCDAVNYNRVQAGYSGENTCYRCEAKPCPSGKSCTYGCSNFDRSREAMCGPICSGCYADNCRNRSNVSAPYGCQTPWGDCPSKCQTAYSDNCRNRSSVSAPYGCQTPWSDCPSKCQTAYSDNCRNRSNVSAPYGCQTPWGDCPSKCQIAYSDNCRNRSSVSAPYGCQTPWGDCPSKCQTAYSDNCRNRSAISIPANGYCSASYGDCSSKCSAFACNAGYRKSGNACVRDNPCPGYSYLLSNCDIPRGVSSVTSYTTENLSYCPNDRNYRRCEVDHYGMSDFVSNMKQGISQFMRIFNGTDWNGRPCQEAMVFCTSGANGMYWGMRGNEKESVEVYIYYSKHIEADGTPGLRCSSLVPVSGCSGGYWEPEG